MLFHIHWDSNVRQTAIHTAEPLVPGPSAFEVVMPIEKLKGKNFSDMFPTRNGWEHGDALSPLLFHIALENATSSVQVKQEGLK